MSKTFLRSLNIYITYKSDNLTPNTDTFTIVPNTKHQQASQCDITSVSSTICNNVIWSTNNSVQTTCQHLLSIFNNRSYYQTSTRTFLQKCQLNNALQIGHSPASFCRQTPPPKQQKH